MGFGRVREVVVLMAEFLELEANGGDVGQEKFHQTKKDSDSTAADLSKSQDSAVGDDTTTVVVIAGAFLRQCLSLLFSILYIRPLSKPSMSSSPWPSPSSSPIASLSSSPLPLLSTARSLVSTPVSSLCSPLIPFYP
uniref:Uncharacterized protein n=1 Tax=Quercus lobata TaxID=97700 RepID=A0A7N2QYR0_QUELO